VTLEQVSLIVFFASIAVCAAAWMVLRDLFWGPIGQDRLRPQSLRRVPTVHDEAPATSLTGRLDQGFEHLVFESGFDVSSVTAFLMLVACGLLAGGAMYAYSANEMLAGLAGSAGMMLPIFAMMILRSRRMREMQEGMPYVVDLLSRAVRAGESVDQAVALVGAETKGVIGREFTRCARQLDMGLALGTVMQSLSRRVRLTELRMLASTLMVHRQTGGNLPVALDRMGGVVRDRLNGARQMRATTGAGRSSTILMAVVSPIAYILCFVYFPDHVRPLLTDPMGRILLILAVCLELTGILWVLALLKRPN
jgi:tight adherence protein B